MIKDGFSVDNKTRKVILNYISAHPGVTFTQIKDVLDVNKSTLRYHLRYLQRRESITSKIENGKKCFYCIGQKILQHPEENRVPLSNVQVHILNVIINNPGITKGNLVFKTRLETHVITYNVDKLVTHKLVWKTRIGKEVGYEYITQEKLHSELLKLLVNSFVKGEIDKETFFRLKQELEKKNLL
jgi:predicted transcriptional regulator